MAFQRSWRFLDTALVDQATAAIMNSGCPDDRKHLAQVLQTSFMRVPPRRSLFRKLIIPDEIPDGNTRTNTVPDNPLLARSYPNPFGSASRSGSPSTVIEYTLPEQGRTTVQVYNLLGRHIATLVDEVQVAGVHQTIFESGVSIPSGIYMYVITTPTVRTSGRMVLAR